MIKGGISGAALTRSSGTPPAQGTDYMWRFDGNLTPISSTTPPINGTDYRPNVLNITPDAYDDVFWYAPGTGADILWNYTSTGITTTQPIAINGTYATGVGDLFADTHTDIYLHSECKASILDWHADSGTLTLTNIPFGVNCLLGSENYGTPALPTTDT